MSESFRLSYVQGCMHDLITVRYCSVLFVVSLAIIGRLAQAKAHHPSTNILGAFLYLRK